MTSISIRRERPAIVARQHAPRVIDLMTALIFATLLALLIRYPMSVNHDAALFLDTGRQILDGKQPYVDFTETNFPLIMYLNAIPVAIADALGVNPIPVFSALVLLLAAGSAWAIRSLLARRYAGDAPIGLQLIPTCVAALTLYLFLNGNYGQREHLFMLLILPGFCLRWLRWEGGTAGRATAILLGLLAGIGVAIKPQFLPIVFAFEAYWIVSAAIRRDFGRIRHALLAPEGITLVGVGLGYAAALLILPNLRDGIFNQILPYASSGYDSYDIGVTPISLLWRLDTVLMGLALLASLPIVIRNRPLARPLWVLTFAAILVFCWQGKGWYYHRIPAIFGATLLIVLTVTQGDLFRLPVADALFKLLLVLLAYLVITLGGVMQVQDHFAAIRSVVLEYSQPGDQVMFIDSSVDPAYPVLIQTGRDAANRNLTGFPITTNAAHDPDLAGYLASLAQSIHDHRPPLILIDAQVPCYGCSQGSGMWEYLQQTGYLARNITPGYSNAGQVANFEIYVRK